MLAMSSERAPVEAWQTQSLRLTVFAILPPSPDSGSIWWSSLVSDAPETETRQPKLARYQADGQIDVGRLILEIVGNRIEISLSSPDDPTKWPENIPSIGAFQNAKKTFFELGDRFLKTCPAIQRLAFGARLILPTASPEDTYTTLSKYLPFKLDAKGSADFFYRINRPRRSTSLPEKASLNRLSTWAALKIQSSGGVLGQSMFPVFELNFCQIELDINTDANFRDELPKEALPSLLLEMIDLATEITAREMYHECR